MGGHCSGGYSSRGSYSSSNYSRSSEPEVEPEPTPSKRVEALIKGECGLFTAFMLTRPTDEDNYPDDVEDYVSRNGYNNLQEFQQAFDSVINHKIRFSTLIKLLRNCDETDIYQYPDLRYNSDRRHFVGTIFNERVVRGFVALKFEGNNDTHWCPIINGKIGILNGEEEEWLTGVGEITNIAPSFDGFTQCAMYLSEEGRNEIENIYSFPCAAKYCNLCFRREFCKEGHKGMVELGKVQGMKRLLDI